ncbi:hydantoinase/carbamoylase family amidase [Luteolibacter sp. AS25]|uniref:hydantoinase/carbamoylase family amidase n=1 Tax=Luteolibacter sp. AS25 TaxID=3135776 RepID=UPI00398A8096
MPSFPDPKRTVAELKELRALTGTEDGAQRVAFTKTWQEARAWLKEKMAELPAEEHADAAGNLWFTLKGESEKALIIGGHMDSVPNGGWLDGSLNVMCGVEILRRIHEEFGGNPPVTVRLVDWADEEGARFGKSLFGSAAFSGNLDMEEARVLKDRDGVPLPDALGECGIDFENVKQARVEQKNAAAYLELHIEQGPVLLDLDLPLAVVQGTYGVERHEIIFHGQAAHSGSTPMNRRKDALLPAARMAAEIYKITGRHGGVCTIGSCKTEPGIVTSVVEGCRITLDQRHLDPVALASMLDDAKVASERFASEANVTVRWEKILGIAPQPFHAKLMDFCTEAILQVSGEAPHLPSGPLHDAAEVSAAGIPTVMMFVQSLHGISHNKIEDTREEHIELSVLAMDHLARRTMEWIQENEKP